jgi:divalent metal cation (Fe/Co/Zn/Cd) transporter
VDFGGDISADQAEEIADEIDKRLADRLPLASHVFLDPTRRPSATPQPANTGNPRP